MCASQKAEITWADFEKVDLRVGTVMEVLPFPKARKPAYRIKVDLGPDIGVRETSAQTTHYAMDELIGTQVICVVNFPEKNIAGFRSQVLVVGVPDSDGRVALLRPRSECPNGGQVY